MRYRLFISFVLLCAAYGMQGQTIEAQFGKNRIQYHDDFDTWKKYETENFITYWYGKAQNIAIPALQIAEKEHDHVRDIMEHRINDKIHLFIYTDITDFKQSNIGVDDVFTSDDNITKVEDNKIFVYFSGDHNKLKEDIRQGIAAVYLNEMMIGSNIREMVKNAVRLEIPKWYEQGIISYAGSEWNYLVDDELRDLLVHRAKDWDFYKLAENFPRISGHSFWYYISETYGESTISNLLYLTKISRSLDEATLYVLNMDLDEVMAGWDSYFKKHYQSEEGKFNSDESYRLYLKNKKDVPVSHLALSRMHDKLAYATNQNGRIKIFLHDFKTQKDQLIYKYGSKNNIQSTDYNYPLLTWREDGTELSCVIEKKDVIYLIKYNILKDEHAEQVIPTRYDRIYSIDYLSDDEYVISALEKGYIDLFIYEANNRTSKQISNDFYDNRDASVITLAGRQGILFSSNRENNDLHPLRYDTIIPIQNFDLFFYELNDESKSLLRLTDTPLLNERYPIGVDNHHIVYLAALTGIKNTYIYYLLENDSYPITNKTRNIIQHDMQDGRYVYTYYKDGAYQIFNQNIDINERLKLPYTTFFNKKAYKRNLITPFKENQLKEDTLRPGYMFQSDYGENESEGLIYDYDEPISTIAATDDTKQSVHQFKNTNVVPSRVNFRVADFVSKMDNEVLFEGLESYVGEQRSVFTPLGFLLKGEMLDMMEDYRLVTGMRLPLNLKGSEYFVVYENRKKRIDKKYALYRKTSNRVVDEQSFPVERERQVSLLGMLQHSYPFDVYRSVRLTTTLRFDKRYTLSSELRTHELPIVDQKRLLAKLEYVFDNTSDYAINIKHGTRYKIYAEGINDFNIEIGDDPEFDLSKGITGIVGFDARHYISVLKHSVLALRGVGATSFGSSQNLFYLGGVNNNLFNKFNETTPILQDENFAYQTNIFHLRGFDTNIRNGSSYALINTELRVPFLRYLLNPYRASSFWKNFQLVGFFDVGTAWYGASPFSDKNPLNTVYVERTSGSGDPIITINAKYYRDPLVMGFGGGIRANLLGYNIRLDIARGYDTKELKERKIHLSLGLDF